MNKMLGIKEWSEDDRPREKFVQRGPQALTKAELLAILVGTGNTEENAIELMRRVLSDCDSNLRRLGQRTVDELMQYKGVGLAKAITILAACELGRRRLKDEVIERQAIRGSDDVMAYFADMRELLHEECRVILLSHANRILGQKLISRGGMTSASVDPRLIIRAALMAEATGFILVHNHPSGTLRPSPDDDRLTERVRQAAQIMDLRLVDHVIVAETGYYSYLEEGRI